MNGEFDIRKLAQQREARLRQTQSSEGWSRPTAPPALTSSLSDLYSASRMAQILLGAHRSVRFARALGLILLAISGILVVFLGPCKIPLITFLVSVATARLGASVVHGLLPPCLVEGAPPQPRDSSGAAGVGLFSLAAARAPLAAIDAEWESFVECAAFVATYGRTNCLTATLYPPSFRLAGTKSGGDSLTLGRVLSAVAEKLRSGTVQCA
eukprot:TRINITY_DN49539_c0_g1_i1.p1 TRINITY_DN49539_c0_g1~~TRINITY_DN49539_c0_g1_i1.p1  ORF type:complete len:211 (-),score=6.41 TRINITY_DN49539_c0_g1_i1:349-981(-)